jgi:fructose-specific phosphotransferase system IIC component
VPLVAIVVLVAAGFVVGFAVGKWRALLAAAGFGIWVAAASELDEVSPAFMGVALGALAGAGVVAGVITRRRRRTPR